MCTTSGRFLFTILKLFSSTDPARWWRHTYKWKWNKSVKLIPQMSGMESRLVGNYGRWQRTALLLHTLQNQNVHYMWRVILSAPTWEQPHTYLLGNDCRSFPTCTIGINNKIGLLSKHEGSCILSTLSCTERVSADSQATLEWATIDVW